MGEENAPVFIFDLDDTLTPIGWMYLAAEQGFSEWVSTELDVPDSRQEIRDLRDLVQFDILEERGHEYGQYPDAFVETYEELCKYAEQEPTEKGQAMAYSWGDEVISQDAEFYRENGFITATDPEDYPVHGADAVLDFLQDHGADLHLVTKGSERLQQPKIDGLELSRWFGEGYAVVDDGEIYDISGADDLNEVNMFIVHRDKEWAMDRISSRYDHDRISMVGNSPTSDIKPAQALGLAQIYFPFDSWAEDHQASINWEHDRLYEIPEDESIEHLTAAYDEIRDAVRL